MMRLTLISILIPLFTSAQLTDSERLRIDSLQAVANSEQSDTARIRALIAWDNLIYFYDNDLDLELNLRIIDIAQEGMEKQGLSYAEKDVYTHALSFSYNNVGIHYHHKGNMMLAVDYYTKSLSVKQMRDDPLGVANTLNNIGSVFHDQKDYEKAMEYYERSLEIDRESNNVDGMAPTLNNIGNIHSEQRNLAEAWKFYRESMKLYVLTGDSTGIGLNLNNMGLLHYYDQEYDSALALYERSLEIRTIIGDRKGAAMTLNNMGDCYFEQGLTEQAIRYSHQAADYAEREEGAIEMRNAYHSLWLWYEAVSDYEKALHYMDKYLLMRDSIQNEENLNGVIRAEYQYEYEKQTIADSLNFIKEQELDQIAHDTALKQKVNQRYALYGGLGFLLLLGGLAVSGYQRKKKANVVITEQKAEVEEQKLIVEAKNQEITDSITYAKRIQEAILPPGRIVKEWLPDSFVLYKPKDIVAGDFYWMETKGDTILFAAADCTGHGVPGAMVSVVCYNSMNRSVREFGLTDPGQILDKTRELVLRTFEKSEEVVRDGMDVALCALNGRTLQYAGAYNPLWIIRNGEILETRADKQPIGDMGDSQPFTSHSIELQPGDTIYVFSDGYVDQFGGDKGKKFKSPNFRKLLLSIESEPMDVQRELIDEAFEAWRGDLEQVDDVCVIGVRV